MSGRIKFKIEGEDAVIRIPLKTIKFATENHDDFWDIEEDKGLLEVTDVRLFTKELFRALDDEAENGSTPFTRCLDDAIAQAIEGGAEGVEDRT